MPKTQTSGNLALKAYDDIFQPTTVDQTAQIEYINGGCFAEKPLSELFPPEFHPFQVRDDVEMERLVRSVSKHGILTPCLTRPRTEGGYELVSGNRRKRACELAGIDTIPIIIREMDDDEAAIIMIDTNLTQREKLLYSERAWAYRVKMEALNHRGLKSDTPGQLSVDILCEQTGESKTQIYRIVQLTELVPDLIDKLDAGALKFNPALELSYLSRAEQLAVSDYLTKYQMRPSLSKAKKLREAAKDGKLSPDLIESILLEADKTLGKANLGLDRFSNYFPADYSTKQMESIIVKLLESWQKNNQEKSN